MQSDTPRTDKEDWENLDGHREVHADFARQLERELAAALQALRKAHDAMVLAQNSHNRVLLCDPPIDAWRQRCVDAHLGDAIRECAAAMRKGGDR